MTTVNSLNEPIGPARAVVTRERVTVRAVHHPFGMQFTEADLVALLARLRQVRESAAAVGVELQAAGAN